MHRSENVTQAPLNGNEPVASRRQNLADALRARTRSLHQRAEASGIIHDILRGQATRSGYALLLRNLLPAYGEMERALDRLRDAPGICTIAVPALYRSRALESDLEALVGASWLQSLPLLDSGERYGRLVASAGEGDGARLVAHAYVRYLGDLNGGRVMKQMLERSLGLEPAQLAFYDFPAIPDMREFRTAYRAALDGAAQGLPEIQAILHEAAEAFRMNVEVSEAVHAAAAARHAAPRDA